MLEKMCDTQSPLEPHHTVVQNEGRKQELFSVISCTSEHQGDAVERTVTASLFLPLSMKTKGERETDFLKHTRKRKLFNASLHVTGFANMVLTSGAISVHVKVQT